MLTVSHVNVRKSISLLVARLIVLYILVTFLTVSMYLSGELIRTQFGVEIRGYDVLISIVINLAELFLAVWIILGWLCEYYEIQTDRIIYRKGIFFQDEEQYYAKNITAIECKESVLGSMFNYGSVHLYDFNNQQHIWMSYLHNPKRCFSVLEQILPKTNIKTEFISKPPIYDIDKSS